MIYEIRVGSKYGIDSKGADLLAEIKRTLHINSVKAVRTNKVYRLEGISQKEADIIRQKVLAEEIDQISTTDRPLIKNSAVIIEIAYKPGVMNPEAASILKAGHDLGIPLKAADSSWEYAFYGKVKNADLKKILERLLVNKTIEHRVVKKPQTLIIKGTAQSVKMVQIRKLNDKSLIELSRDRLFLNLEEMKIIQNYFRKTRHDPTDCEVEVLAQTWSEHCVHKTFKAKLTVDGKNKESLISRIKGTLKFNEKIVVSAFDDNSGVIDFYDGYAISGKVETHNSPSAIEPYGGAMTGSGGVFRDILGTGKGAKPIISTDIFCFAPPNLPAADLPPGCLAPGYLLRKVVAGVRDYGNRVGIPTNNGSIHFHRDFRAKPTVAVGSYGIIPKDKAKMGKVKSGDLILTVGGRTGRDGIHGATFSSGEMSARTINTSGSAVQIGNAIEEKRVIDLILVLRDKNLIEAITDCGAGGYSSAVGEMGKKTGAQVQLEHVPLKYEGLAPWEIFLSESQERMVIAIKPKNLKKVQKMARLYNVKIANIGKFTSNKRLVVKYKNTVVCNFPMEFLHNGLPQRHMTAINKKRDICVKTPKQREDLTYIWKKVLAHPNVASKEPIVRLYDHTVQGTAALQPFIGENYDGPSDGAIVRPLLDKSYGVATAHGLNPAINLIDPYWGSIWAVVEAVSNYVSIGGDLKTAGLIDNFIWPFPDEESLADLDKSVDACVDMAKILKMPFVSGKDSLSSTYRFPDNEILKIPPVLLISVFGKIKDVKKTVSSDFKKAESTLVLVGNLDVKNLGGSTYFDIANGSGDIPKVDLKYLPRVLKAVTKGIQSGSILSTHDISEGGLAATIAEMSIGGYLGATIDLLKIGHSRPDLIFFSETAGTFLVEVEDEKIAKKAFFGVPAKIIGKTTKVDVVTVKYGTRTIATDSIENLKKPWQKTFREIFHD